MTATNKLVTSDEFLAMGDIGRCELLYGEIIKMSPSGFEHGQVAARLAILLGQWNDARKGGIILGAETGFVLERNPDVVRAPDVAYVSRDRIGESLPRGFFDGAPDLAVEVVSPFDAWPEVQAKVDMWLARGARSCWVVDPRNKQVWLYNPAGEVRKLTHDGVLEDDILPGFVVKVETIFEW